MCTPQKSAGILGIQVTEQWGKMGFLILVGWKWYARFKSSGSWGITGRKWREKMEEWRKKKKSDFWLLHLWEVMALRPSNMAGPYGATERYAVGVEVLGQEQEERKSLYSLIKSINSLPVKSSVEKNEWHCKWRQMFLKRRQPLQWKEMAGHHQNRRSPLYEPHRDRTVSCGHWKGIPILFQGVLCKN